MKTNGPRRPRPPKVKRQGPLLDTPRPGVSGRGGMGMRKHGKSGWKHGAGKSPKLRHALKREAEAEERKRRALPLQADRVRDLFEPE